MIYSKPSNKALGAASGGRSLPKTLQFPSSQAFSLVCWQLQIDLDQGSTLFPPMSAGQSSDLFQSSDLQMSGVESLITRPMPYNMSVLKNHPVQYCPWPPVHLKI